MQIRCRNHRTRTCLKLKETTPADRPRWWASCRHFSTSAQNSSRSRSKAVPSFFCSRLCDSDSERHRHLEFQGKFSSLDPAQRRARMKSGSGKFYVHVEDVEPNFTCPFVIEPGLTVRKTNGNRVPSLVPSMRWQWFCLVRGVVWMSCPVPLPSGLSALPDSFPAWSSSRTWSTSSALWVPHPSHFLAKHHQIYKTLPSFPDVPIHGTYMHGQITLQFPAVRMRYHCGTFPAKKNWKEILRLCWCAEIQCQVWLGQTNQPLSRGSQSEQVYCHDAMKINSSRMHAALRKLTSPRSFMAIWDIFC